MNPLIPEHLSIKASIVKAVIFDVDGVLTDSKIIYDNQGNELKHFNVKDGFMIKMLMKQGFKVGAITGRNSEVVKFRLKELDLDFHCHGSKNKTVDFEKILTDFQLRPSEIAYVGDDWPDLPVLLNCGLSCTPADANHFVKDRVDWILQTKGGEGCIRELGEGILFAQNLLQSALTHYLS